MKIGMILDKKFPPDGRVENEARTLIEKGFSVRLFALNFQGRNGSVNFNGIQVHYYKFSLFLRKKLVHLAYTFPFYHFLLKNKIKHFVEKNHIDIIHVHDIDIAGIVYKLNKKWQLPIVLDLHENRPEIMKEYSHVNSGIGKYLISINRWQQKQNQFIRDADHIIVVTNEAKSTIITENSKNPESITVVPNTVNLNMFFDYPIEQKIVDRYQNNFVILYLGVTGFRRGIDTAIKSMVFLKDKIKNIKLVIVGNSRDDKDLSNLASQLGVLDYIDFEGWKDVKLFPSYIIASRICISPLVRNKHHDTTFANKLFQYMAFGKPVVVSDCTAQKNVVENTGCGLVHESGNENDLAQKIEFLYQNKKLISKMGEKAKKAVMDTYNWKFTSHGLVTLYYGYANKPEQ